MQIKDLNSNSNPHANSKFKPRHRRSFREDLAQRHPTRGHRWRAHKARALPDKVLAHGTPAWSNDARHPRSPRRPQAHDRVLDHHTPVCRQADPLPRQIVNQGVRLLLRHVVSGHQHIHACQAIQAHDRVDHLLEPGLGRRTADAHRNAWVGNRLVHQLQDPLARLRDLLHNFLIELCLLVLQIVDEPVLDGLVHERVRVRVFQRRIHHHRPVGLAKVPAHLRLTAANRIGQNVIVLGRPVALDAVDVDLEVLEGGVVGQPMQLLRLDQDTVAVKQERK
mmetsp:Transcript_4473/g.12641  ORF Transcript_4473/g.12641 Transcript_4473/m.12641 type:complete len:279 (+) Transcript_4473:2414-3250(+)